MKKTALPLILLPLYITTGCNTGSFRNYSNASGQESMDTAAIAPYTPVKNAQDTAPPAGDCVRGIPGPIVKKKVYPNTNFVLQQDHRSGTETVVFDNNDKLIITNTGCDYFSLKFHFETARFSCDSVSKKYWFKTGCTLMKDILKGLNAPIDLTKGIRKLDDLIRTTADNNYKRLAFGKEFDYGSENMRSIVMLDPVQKMRHNVAVVTISFSVRPL